MVQAVVIVASYLMGSVPFGVLIGRAWRGVDVRKYGSGNIGFSNVLRVLGPLPASVVLLGDALKGFLPMWAGRMALHSQGVPQADLWLLAVGLAAILGHTFSIFLRLGGGRAVTTTGGVLLGLCWPAAAFAVGTWLILVGLTRYISVGSIAAAVSIPIYMAITRARWEWLVFWCLIAALVIARHAPNIRRLLAGTETKIGEKVETGAGPDDPR